MVGDFFHLQGGLRAADCAAADGDGEAFLLAVVFFVAGAVVEAAVDGDVATMQVRCPRDGIGLGSLREGEAED